jgi:hypothetical protein
MQGIGVRKGKEVLLPNVRFPDQEEKRETYNRNKKEEGKIKIEKRALNRQTRGVNEGGNPKYINNIENIASHNNTDCYIFFSFKGCRNGSCNFGE